MEKAVIVNLVCHTIENVVMTVGIVYAAVYFNRFSILWFLLMPLLNSTTLRSAISRNNKEGANSVDE